MNAALPIALSIVGILALAALVDGILRSRRLRRQLEDAWRAVPKDPETGLYDRRVCVQRVAAELKRARRGGGTVWIGVLTVLDGDPARFGRLLHDSMRLPAVGFRIGDGVMCIARPDLDLVERAELLGRVRAAAPRERLAVGEALWRGPADGDAIELLRRASEASIEVEP